MTKALAETRRWAPKFSLAILFEPRDLWIGFYWNVEMRVNHLSADWYLIYLCIIPCFPIRLEFPRRMIL